MEKKQTFEEYLEEQWFKDYHGDKDHAEDSFNYWLEHLEGEDYITYATEWEAVINF